LAGEGFRAVPAPADERLARDELRRGRLGLVVLLPAHYDGTGPVTVLADPALDALQLLAFRERLLGAALGIDLKRATNVSVEVIGSPRPARPSSVQQNVPAWLIFGMFFVVLPISALFIVERRDGTAARLRSQQVAFSLLLVGKIGPFFVINLLQTVLMLAAGLTLVPWLAFRPWPGRSMASMPCSCAKAAAPISRCRARSSSRSPPSSLPLPRGCSGGAAEYTSHPPRRPGMPLDHAFYSTWTPRAQAVLRIVTAYLFIAHGTAKLFGAPHVGAFDNLRLFSLIGLAGTIELVGSVLLLLGLFTRP